jgi:hypothetical protein
MSTTIKLRRSSIPGRAPTTSQLEFGEIAINTADAKVYFKSGNNTVSEIQELSPHASDLLTLIKTVDGASSGLDADLLDGQEGSYYLDYNNFVNVPPATLDLTLDGKVTGTAFSNTGVMTLTTELANTGVTPGTYGSSNQIPILTIDEDGRVTSASNTAVAGVNDFTWDSANNQLQLTTGDGSVYNIYLNEFKDLTVEDLTANSININTLGFDALEVSGDISANNIHVTGTVDGRDIAADGAVLDTLAASTTTVNLTGDVEGTGTANSSGIVAITAELTNTGVTADSYGSANTIPIITVDEDGRITAASTISVDIPAGVESLSYLSANNTLTLTTSDNSFFTKFSAFDENVDFGAGIDVTGNVNVTSGNLDVGGIISADGTLNVEASSGFANIEVGGPSGGYLDFKDPFSDDFDARIMWNGTQLVLNNAGGAVILQYQGANKLITAATGISVSGDITVSGNVDGRDVAADGSKLDGIEAGATADQTAADIRGLGFFDTTNDGSGSGLDADLLDGYQAAGLLDQAANNASALIGDGEVNITANNGLTGSGTFTLNSANTFNISIEHADTSSVTDANNSDGNVIQDLTFDSFGHVQTVASTNLDDRYYTEDELSNTGILDSRYYTETELDGGQLNTLYYTETEVDGFLALKADKSIQIIAGNALTGGGTLGSDVTINHQDTSSQSSVNGSGGVVIQDVTLDTYGHVTGLGTLDLDGRYYTETEADARFVNVTGDTMTGDLVVQANIDQDQSRFISTETNAGSVLPFVGLQFSATTYGSAEVTVTAKDGSNRHITKFLITHNGSTAIATEYGTVYTSSELAGYDVSLTSGNVRLEIASFSGSSNFKIVATLLKA